MTPTWAALGSRQATVAEGACPRESRCDAANSPYARWTSRPIAASPSTIAPRLNPRKKPADASMSTVKKFVSDLVADSRQANVFAAIFVGCVTGSNMIIIGNALGTIVFSGRLEPFRSSGIGLFLFSMAVVSLVIAMTSGYRGAISAPPTATAMALIAIVTTMEAQGEALWVTTLATVALSAVAAGLCFLAISRFRLSNMMQFIPYPVAGGFLAGTGGILCLAGLSMMGVPFDWESLPRLFDPLTLWNWAPGVAFAVGLLVATKRWNHILLFPVSFVLVAGLYHVGLDLSGISGDAARSAGLLFSGTAERVLWPPVDASELGQVDWIALAKQTPNMITLVLITLICVVMNVGGLEQIASVELDWNKEFRSAGLASLIAGIGGGPPGCQLVAVTIRSRMFGAETWMTGAFAALLVGCGLFLGDGLVSVIPVPVTAGIVVFTGVSMLNEWFSKNLRRLPHEDLFIVILILITTVMFGFLEGVTIGMAVTLVFFAVRLSRLDLIEANFSAREHQSNKKRSIPDRTVLLREGHRLQAYQLRGYIFFGTAHRLAARLKQALNGDPPPVCMLLDFSAVSGFDLSAVSAFCRFIQNAHAGGTRIALSAVPEKLREGLRQGLPSSAFDRLLWGAELDSALEQCEDLTITASKNAAPDGDGDSGESLLEAVADEMEGHLSQLALFEELADELRPWLDQREYDVGAALVTSGDVQKETQLLIGGAASGYNAAGKRLFQSSPGDILEPRGAFGDCTAAVSIIADERCQTLSLTQAGRELLERDEPELALKLCRYLLSAEPYANLGSDR